MTALLRLPSDARAGAPAGLATIDVDQVIEGDLVFCARSGFLQQLCQRADEPWRHVGLMAEVDGVPSICEVAGGRFGHRPLATLAARYDAVAIARVLPRYRERARWAARWAVSFADRPHVYAWDDLILAGMIAVSRCYVLPDEEEVLTRSLQAAISAMRPGPAGAGALGTGTGTGTTSTSTSTSTASGILRPSAASSISADTDSFTCASFIAEALHRFAVPLEIDLTTSRCRGRRPSLLELVRSRYRPLRSAAGSRINGEQLLSLTRALLLGVVAASTGLTAPDQAADLRRWATPGDLWRSPTVGHRWYLDRGLCHRATDAIE